LFASQIIVAVGITIVVASSSTLHFWGKGKSSRTSAQISSKENEEPKTEESKIEELKHRAKSSTSQRLIPIDQLEKSKRELRTLLLEKNLASAALTRLYEAEAAKEITKEEREILGAKYRQELKSLDSKILGIDAFIEVGDLETLRDQLLQLVSEKIDAIDRRIEGTKIAASPLIKNILDRSSQKSTTVQSELEAEKREKPPVPDISDLLTPATTQTSVPAETSGIESTGITEPVVAETTKPSPKRRNAYADGQVEELQKELLEALDRLEKLDVET
jgi:hypothetical protein